MRCHWWSTGTWTRRRRPRRPIALAALPDGSLAVGTRDAILRVGPAPSRTVETYVPLPGPLALAPGPDGTLYAARNNAIYAISPAAQHTVSIFAGNDGLAGL